MDENQRKTKGKSRENQKLKVPVKRGEEREECRASHQPVTNRSQSWGEEEDEGDEGKGSAKIDEESENGRSAGLEPCVVQQGREGW